MCRWRRGRSVGSLSLARWYAFTKFIYSLHLDFQNRQHLLHWWLSLIEIGNFSCLTPLLYFIQWEWFVWSPWSPQSVWSLRLVWSVCVVALVRPVSLGLVSLEDLVTLVSLLTICILNNFQFHLSSAALDGFFSLVYFAAFFSLNL